jgi:hypothetical protein
LSSGKIHIRELKPVLCIVEKNAEDLEITNLCLACHTQEEIAEAIGMPEMNINNIRTNFQELGFPSKLGQSVGKLKITRNGWIGSAGKIKLRLIT